MIELIIGIAKLLGSAGFGTIFGGLMGIVNRKVDLQARALDLQEADRKRAHELAMRDKDAAIMAQEWAARTQVASVEAEGRLESAAYDATGKSYGFAQPERGSKMASFSAFVRPWISLGYWVVTSVGSAALLYYAFAVRQITLTPEQWHELVMYVVAWLAFMAGSTIGWWFAMRPGGRMPVFPSTPGGA